MKGGRDLFDRIKSIFNRREPEKQKNLGLGVPIFTSIGQANSIESGLFGSDSYDITTTKTLRKRATLSDEWKSVPSICSAINSISSFIGMQPWKLYYKDADGEEQEIDDEPYLNVLKNPANGETGITFKRLLIESYLTKGGFAFYIERGSNNIPISLVVLNIDGLSEPDISTLTSSESVNSYFNYVGLFKGKHISTKLNKSDVVLVQDLNCELTDRSSRLESLALDIGVYCGSKLFQKEYFDNGASPGTYIKVDEEPGQAEIDMMERNFITKFGKGNRHKPLIGSGEISVIGNGMKDVDVSALNLDLARDTSFALGVPSSMLGYTSNSNRATVEKEEQNYRQYTLAPLLVRLDDELTYKYFYEQYGGQVYLRHDDITINSVLTAEEKLDKIKDLIGTVYTVNEARKIAGLKPLDDKRYDELGNQDSKTLEAIRQLTANE